MVDVVVQRQARLPDQVADALQRQIAAGRLRPGEKLPPERLLCAQLGVSRTVIREAVRSLAAKGLVDVRSGGGVWVRQPTARPAAELLGIAMQTAGGGVSWADVLEIRRLVEVEAAGRAAQRRGGADLRQLADILDAQRASRGDPGAGAETDMRFHEALASATHNALMPVLLGAMETVLLDARRLAYGLQETLDNALLHHERILEAVRRGDATGARGAMLEHLWEAESTLRRAQETRPPLGDAGDTDDTGDAAPAAQ
jgi:GntR family transcriptional regulator, transcriptional repressor for pyruvate dehydrogenase complex